jgi:hypothetical protein
VFKKIIVAHLEARINGEETQQYTARVFGINPLKSLTTSLLPRFGVVPYNLIAIVATRFLARIIIDVVAIAHFPNCLAHTVKVHPSGEGSRAHRKSFDLRSGWRANPRKDNRSHQFESVVNDLIETIMIRARWPSITPVSGSSGAGVVRKELHATFSQIARSL